MRNIRANSISLLRDEHVKQNLAFLLSQFALCVSTVKRKENAARSSRASKVLVTQMDIMQPGKRGCSAHCIKYIFVSLHLAFFGLRRRPKI
jgi:hypothetical protein